MVLNWYHLSNNETYCTREEVKMRLLQQRFFLAPYFFLVSDYDVHLIDGGGIVMEEDCHDHGRNDNHGHKSFKTKVSQQDGSQTWDGYFTPLTVLEYIKTDTYTFPMKDFKVYKQMIYMKPTYYI